MAVTEVVSLQDILSDSPISPASRPRVAITFDDAYGGAMTVGMDELKKRGMPATVFVAPGFLGGHAFWWDEVAPPGSMQLPADARERFLTELRGLDPLVRRWALDNGYQVHAAPPAFRCASEEQVAMALQYSGLSLGAHSWNHPNLAGLDDGALREELVRPLEWLESRFQRVMRVLAYPYGLADAATEAAVLAAGYRAAFKVTGGWLPPALASARFRLPRLDVSSQLSLDGFALRLSGLFTNTRMPVVV